LTPLPCLPILGRTDPFEETTMKPLVALLASTSILLTAASCTGNADENEIPGPKVGDVFPHTLEAPDQDGKLRTLAGLYGEKGAAVFFVRSADWCPFCRGQLVDVNSHLPEFEALGLSVVSISVDEVPLVKKFFDEQQIGYTMLADPNGDINESLGIRDPQYPVGSAAFVVPRPTLYIIDRSGVIRLRYMEPTYRTRPDLDVVLDDVRQLKL
jgi:peroxiredoxin